MENSRGKLKKREMKTYSIMPVPEAKGGSGRRREKVGKAWKSRGKALDAGRIGSGAQSALHQTKCQQS